MKIQELDDYLQNLLNLNLIKDSGVNGIQIENTSELNTISFAVDSTLTTIQNAIKLNTNVLIVHHGLFWGKQEIITGSFYQKIKLLIEHNIALYAIHLPLDIHPQLGNNITIAQCLKIQELEQSLAYKDLPLGYIGTLSKDILLSQLAQYFPHSFRIEDQNKIQSLDKDILRIGISSGAFSSELFLQNKHKVDLFLTGEVSLPTYNLCLDEGIPIIALGHYYTEVFGLQSLMKYLEQKFPQLNCKFIDEDKYI